jgi:hypothetical protein
VESVAFFAFILFHESDHFLPIQDQDHGEMENKLPARLEFATIAAYLLNKVIYGRLDHK